MTLHTRVGFVVAQRDFWRGYLDFYGRTTRASYWWVQLVLGVVFLVVGGWLWLTASWQALLVAGGLLFGLFLPYWALKVRRLRDAGMNGRGAQLWARSRVAGRHLVAE